MSAMRVRKLTESLKKYNFTLRTKLLKKLLYIAKQCFLSDQQKVQEKLLFN